MRRVNLNLIGRTRVIIDSERSDAAGHATVTVHFQNGQVQVFTSDDLPASSPSLWSRDDLVRTAESTLGAFGAEKTVEALTPLLDGALDSAIPSPFFVRDPSTNPHSVQ